MDPFLTDIPGTWYPEDYPFFQPGLGRPMPQPIQIDPEVEKELLSLYEEIMWLAARPKVTPSMARAWYTHVVAERLKRRIRIFSGKVSKDAATDPDAILRLEHHGRIQTKLTDLVRTHRKTNSCDPSEFIKLLIDCENVHIVTLAENYEAMRHAGNYKNAGIKLISWRSIPKDHRKILWKRMLYGKVANANDFA